MHKLEQTSSSNDFIFFRYVLTRFPINIDKWTKKIKLDQGLMKYSLLESAYRYLISFVNCTLKKSSMFKRT